MSGDSVSTPREPDKYGVAKKLRTHAEAFPKEPSGFKEVTDWISRARLLLHMGADQIDGKL